MNELINLWWVVIIALVFISGLSLCFPVMLIKLSRIGSRRFDIPADKVLNKSVDIDRILYRHHLISGSVICLLSAGTLYLLVFVLDLSPASMQTNSRLLDWQSWMLEALMTASLVAAVIGCCLGVVMMLRPSLIKPLESWGNRWVTVPTELLDKEISGHPIESWVIQHTRLFGVLTFLAAWVIWVLVFGLN
ncbi:MAG: hypothetical protein JXA04_04805 [Gammaproteobacteria bacterium]|nr:hypothetical protein [Gammaproteobacteria bacterium]